MCIATQNAVGNPVKRNFRALACSVSLVFLAVPTIVTTATSAFANDRSELARASTANNTIFGHLTSYVSSLKWESNLPDVDLKRPQAVQPAATEDGTIFGKVAKLIASSKIDPTTTASTPTYAPSPTHQGTTLRGSGGDNTVFGKVSTFFKSMQQGEEVVETEAHSVASEPGIFEVSDIATGLRDGIGYTVENAVDVALFKPTRNAIADRDVTIEMPGH